MEHFDIEAWKKERDEVIASCDLIRVVAYFKKWNPDMPLPTIEVMEAGMHKARTGLLSLPEAEREKSRQWLRERGYKPLA